MWSATTEPSDNKQNEVADDDCQCGGSGGGSSSTSSTTINSKRETSSSFGANFDRSDAKKLLAGGGADLSGETGGDSGFISGPQTSSSTNIFHDDDGGDDVVQADDSNKLSGGSTAAAAPSASQQQQKFNIAPQQPQQQPQRKQNKEEKLVLDSGCIDEDDFDDDDGGDDDAADGDDEYDERAEAGQPQQQHASATAAYQLEQQAQSEAQKLPSHANTADQMILKNNVDAGISQWFCQLSLQTDNGRNGSGNNTANSSQSQQQQVAGLGMNNLDSQRRSTGNAFSNRQQQQAAGNSATTTLTPSNAWEQFYQQNDDGDTPLHLACISGFADVVAALIRMAPHPCLFNIQNDEAQTPLHLAALTAQPKILRMLLIAGAEPTIRDRHGNTALHLACISGEEQCVRALTIPISASEINEAHRQYGHRSNDETVSYLKCANLPSDLEIPNYDGERCVHLAAQAGHIDILRILVLYGADINAREGKSGRTPLHIAIECCNEDLANFLLDECQKLNLETATYAGLTAYQVACILNKSQMQYMLEKRGAETLPTPDSDYDSSDMETDLDDSKIYNRFGDPGYFVGYNGGNPMTVA